jgi:hypothetical protein
MSEGNVDLGADRSAKRHKEKEKSRTDKLKQIFLRSGKSLILFFEYLCSVVYYTDKSACKSKKEAYNGFPQIYRFSSILPMRQR